MAKKSGVPVTYTHYEVTEAFERGFKNVQSMHKEHTPEWCACQALLGLLSTRLFGQKLLQLGTMATTRPPEVKV